MFTHVQLDTKEWGLVKLARIWPENGDILGKFRCLEDTPWGSGIVTVSGEAFSHALHGHITPLMREIGVPPGVHLKRCSGVICASPCLNFDARVCRPCKEMPDCYVPSGVSDIKITMELAKAWRDGVYVIAVDGPEFI